MGWKSAINPPDSIRDVVCKCEVGCAEYRILIGFWYEDDDRWMVAGFPGAVVVQWHEIPKGWKRKGKK